ncbi:hypothetical protein [Maricaulis sp.]|uniref:hypothetical protein n=1 Tax=Maricaulis sp. TaxID=1486257 RepID=UPI001B147085|nr:hypothetical protein [Maricaulis sp.]MBO6796454.1 hypothetical protein [Maricaulis sp.]
MTTRSRLALFRIFAALLGVFGLLHLMGLGRDYSFISIGFFTLVVAVAGYLARAVVKGRHASPHLRWRRMLFATAVALAVLFAVAVGVNLFVY